MFNIYIISSNFFDIVESRYTIGGIQTYIKDLGATIIKQGHKAFLVQFSNARVETEINTYGSIPVILFPYKKRIINTREQRTFNSFY